MSWEVRASNRQRNGWSENEGYLLFAGWLSFDEVRCRYAKEEVERDWAARPKIGVIGRAIRRRNKVCRGRVIGQSLKVPLWKLKFEMHMCNWFEEMSSFHWLVLRVEEWGNVCWFECRVLLNKQLLIRCWARFDVWQLPGYKRPTSSCEFETIFPTTILNHHHTLHIRRKKEKKEIRHGRKFEDWQEMRRMLENELGMWTKYCESRKSNEMWIMSPS